MDKTEEIDAENCKHHWLLGKPKDGVVQGRCKLCGKSREYQDDFEPPVFLKSEDRKKRAEKEG